MPAISVRIAAEVELSWENPSPAEHSPASGRSAYWPAASSAFELPMEPFWGQSLSVLQEEEP